MSAQPAKPRLVLKTGIAIVVVVVLVLVLFNQFRSTASVATVYRGTAVDSVTGSVVVHADKDLQEIKSEMAGRVIWIDPRQLGQPFKKGEPIVKLDASDLERQKKQAADDFNAQLERTKLQQKTDPTLVIAQEKLDRAKLAFSRHEISETDAKNAQREFDNVQTNLALADLDLKQKKIDFDYAQQTLQRQIDEMTIRAPMDGIVQSVMVAPGALIGQNTTVATFFSNERVVIAKVGEEEIGKVKVGQPAEVRLLNLGDELFSAKVTTILPFADPDTQRYSVYLDVKANPSQLKPFSTGEATITVGVHQNQPLIPRRALFNDDYVFVVKGGVVEKRRVTVGYRALNLAEITGNLSPGEQVIVDDLDQFRDGQHVRVEEAK
ncbi:MAG TPA: efflux RND transporter periplasmic adaptor subunit [Opitutaceae bacterium]|nr:efflux RND transporter periplasmic adaptor subunit [Opitutaceae bacterium]